MAGQPALRRDLTPCILHTDLTVRGGGIARAVPERASLYARHFERVMIMTTAFSPRLDAVVAELRERGGLDERVTVRNFFRDSAWVRGLGVPPADAYTAAGPTSSPSRRSCGRSRRPHRRQARGPTAPVPVPVLRPDGRLLLTSTAAPLKKHEVGVRGADDEPIDVTWGSIVAQWVDEEIAGLRKPVLFSLQRGLVDPVLLATTKASRKVVSLHNCHYRDPEDPTSGIRPIFRPVLLGSRKVDEVVCLTVQQRRELEVDAPRAVIRSINYPGRPRARRRNRPTTSW